MRATSARSARPRLVQPRSGGLAAQPLWRSAGRGVPANRRSTRCVPRRRLLAGAGRALAAGHARAVLGGRRVGRALAGGCRTPGLGLRLDRAPARAMSARLAACRRRQVDQGARTSSACFATVRHCCATTAPASFVPVSSSATLAGCRLKRHARLGAGAHASAEATRCAICAQASSSTYMRSTTSAANSRPAARSAAASAPAT